MKLKEWRREKALTQTEFAGMIGSSQTTVSDWESGKAVPEAEAMRAVFTATNGAVTPNDFVLADA